MKNKLHLLIYFLRKDLKAKYAGSALGVIWTFLMPVIQILLLWLVFSTIMKARPYGNMQMPYIYFLLSSYFFWLAFLEGTMRAANSIIENSEIVKKISFPNIILPITAALSSYLPHILGFILFIVVYGIETSFSPILLLVMPVLLFQVIFSLGVGMILASLMPYVRDLGQLLGQALQGIFFLSPIIYSIEAVPEKLKIIFYLNPITYFVVSYQKIILLGEVPSFSYLSAIACLSLSCFIGGYFLFHKLKEGFSDVL
ncbi:MAG: ABC transporter permease [Nitrospirae bacterium]|nr:ABC transporter permease [Nitrospirota bacterium]